MRSFRTRKDLILISAYFHYVLSEFENPAPGVIHGAGNAIFHPKRHSFISFTDIRFV